MVFKTVGFENTNKQQNSAFQNSTFTKNTGFENSGFPENGAFEKLQKTKTRVLRNARRRANRENVAFHIRDFNIRFPKTCPLTGITIDYDAPPRASNAPSLIRKDSSEGYSPGNVQVVSYRAAQSQRLTRGPRRRRRPPTSTTPGLLETFLALGRRALEEGWGPDRFETIAYRIYQRSK